MKLNPLFLKGAYLIETEQIPDNRGYFLRTFDLLEFKKFGLNLQIKQSNLSYNHLKNTLRGLHYQKSPYEEVKLVQCIQGSIFDVIVDLRPESGTYKQWYGEVLSSENQHIFYIPTGFAHGFITLENKSIVSYQMGETYHPKAACGIHWDDPSLNISWPNAPEVISERDKDLPYL